MTSMWPQLEPLLAKVGKPARYIGCEEGAQQPQHGPDTVSWLLIYPDTYEIGLPNQGLQILYEILNERPDAAAERSYAPWVDLEAELRANNLPLFSVDTHRPAPLFDLLAFNLSAELTYTNLLNCIDLAHVPVRAFFSMPVAFVFFALDPLIHAPKEPLLLVLFPISVLGALACWYCSSHCCAERALTSGRGFKSARPRQKCPP